MFKKKIHVKTHIQSTACRLHPTLRVLIEDYQFRYSLSTLLANCLMSKSWCMLV